MRYYEIRISCMELGNKTLMARRLDSLFAFSFFLPFFLLFFFFFFFFSSLVLSTVTILRIETTSTQLLYFITALYFTSVFTTSQCVPSAFLSSKLARNLSIPHTPFLSLPLYLNLPKDSKLMSDLSSYSSQQENPSIRRV